MVGSASAGIGGSVGSGVPPTWHDDGIFDRLSESVGQTFAQATADPESRLFKVDSSDLFEIYLSNLPAEARQHHTCNCCKQFVERFGGIVCVGENGSTKSAIWDYQTAPGLYMPAVRALQSAVQDRPVAGAHVSSDTVWGTPATRDRALGKTWYHFAVMPRSQHVRKKSPSEKTERERLDASNRVAAEVKEHHRILTDALAEFPLSVAAAALGVVRGGTLPRVEVVRGAAEHFHATQTTLASIKLKKRKSNFVWRTVARAPAGYCTPKTSMLGTLLKGLGDGEPVEKVVRDYTKRVDPTVHMRPQAPTTQGNIAQAEKIVENLGIRPSLARRHASLSDVRAVWVPTPPRSSGKQAGGVFGGLPTKTTAKSPPTLVENRNPVRIRWEKFARTVLPEAQKIELHVEDYLNYVGLTAPVVPDAPPILQWDSEDERNPIAWYVYTSPTPASSWSLTRGTWAEVERICLQPSMWGSRPTTHHGQSAVLLLKGARDRMGTVGSCLFPAILRSELHQIRATIESYSNTNRLGPAIGTEASGVRVADGAGTHLATIRVTTALGIQHYVIDAWD